MSVLCMYVSVSVYVCACICVCMGYACVSVSVYVCTDIQIYIHTYIHIIYWGCTCMHVHIHMRIHKHTHTHTHTCIHRAVLRAKRATLTQQALPIMAIPEPLLDVVARALLLLDLCLLRARNPSRMSPLVPRMRAQPAWTPQVKSARRSGQAVSPRAVC